MDTNRQIIISEKRQRIRVNLDTGLVLEGPIGTTAGEFLAAVERETGPYAVPLIAAICNGQLRELNYPIETDSTLKPVLLSSSDGGRIYRRSLVLLMVTAAAELWPGCRISVRYAVTDGGFYCKRLDDVPFSDDDLARLEAHMRHIADEDAPITKHSAPVEDVQAMFAARQEDDKVRLLEQRTRPTLTLYTLRGRSDYYYGYMMPATGSLHYFKLINVQEGFILQYPRSETAPNLKPIHTYNKLGQVFQQADHWLQKLEVEDIGKLNRIVHDENRLRELVLVAEALHEGNIAQIASDIYDRHIQDGVRLVLISGPSASGKTTFSKRLAIQLLANGLHPFTLELDNYFVDRRMTPLDEQGEYDFESLYAVNLPLFNRHLNQLIQGEQIQLPRFDFHTGTSNPDRIAQLKPNQIIIVEGIHGLNPALVPDIDDSLIHRVYVSALTQLNVDTHNRVPTTDVRMLRRIVRDALRRGYSATDTLKRWPSVRRGEKRNIFPYQDNADSMFNSALVYEMAALRPLAEPLLFQVEANTPAHIEAKRLLSFLSWVKPMSPEQLDLIPDTSLLREFIGKSILHDYHPG